MSSDNNVPWPIWAAVTLLAACITAYATLSASRYHRISDSLGAGSSTIEGQGTSNQTDEDNQRTLADRYQGELDQTLKGSFMAAELAIRKVSEVPLAQYFKGSALNDMFSLVQEERERREQGSIQEINLQWEQESTTVSPRPLRAEVLGRLKVRESIRRIDTGKRLVGPSTEDVPIIAYLRNENGRWWIFAIEER